MHAGVPRVYAAGINIELCRYSSIVVFHGSYILDIPFESTNSTIFDIGHQGLAEFEIRGMINPRPCRGEEVAQYYPTA